MSTCFSHCHCGSPIATPSCAWCPSVQGPFVFPSLGIRPPLRPGWGERCEERGRDLGIWLLFNSVPTSALAFLPSSVPSSEGWDCWFPAFQESCAGNAGPSWHPPLSASESVFCVCKVGPCNSGICFPAPQSVLFSLLCPWSFMPLKIIYLSF